MNLHIKDFGWGIGRGEEGYAEKQVAEATFPIEKEGPLPPVGPARHVFVINKIGEDCIEVACSPIREPVVIKKGEAYTYRPRSFDGGHFYHLELE